MTKYTRAWWRRWSAAAAGGWSLFTMILGIYWWAGGDGFPFGHNDIAGPGKGSLLTGVEQPTAAPAVAVFGLVGAGLAWTMDRRAGGRVRRPLTIAGGVLIVGLLAGLVLDARALTLLPPLGLFGWSLIEDWPTAAQLPIALGAALFTASTTAYVGHTRDPRPQALAREARTAARWAAAGRVAAVIAVLCPLPYAVIRLTWAAGHPIGVPGHFVEMLERNQPGVTWMEMTLASFAIIGAVLTSGLLCRWGRVFPAWIPVLGRRPVPLWFPVAFAASAATGIFGFGRSMWYGPLGIEIAGAPEKTLQTWGMDVARPEFWGLGGLGWLFPVWALALALATVGYVYRRRETEAPAAALPPHPPS